MNPYPLPILRTFHSDHQARDKWQALKILEEASETVEAAKACINKNPTDTRAWGKPIHVVRTGIGVGCCVRVCSPRMIHA